MYKLRIPHYKYIQAIHDEHDKGFIPSYPSIFNYLEENVSRQYEQPFIHTIVHIFRCIPILAYLPHNKFTFNRKIMKKSQIYILINIIRFNYRAISASEPKMFFLHLVVSLLTRTRIMIANEQHTESRHSGHQDNDRA